MHRIAPGLDNGPLRSIPGVDTLATSMTNAFEPRKETSVVGGLRRIASGRSNADRDASTGNFCFAVLTTKLVTCLTS